MADSLPQAVKTAVLAVLHAADRRSYGITRMKLAKLLYLCDLEAVRTGQQPFTGVTWRWLHYGPYSPTLRNIEDALVLAGDIDRQATVNFYGNDEYRLRPKAPFPRIAPEYWAIVDAMVNRHGAISPSTLKDFTYQTEPMVTAQQSGHRGCVLDLFEVRPLPDIGPPLRALRRVRDRLEHASTDPEVWDELRDDYIALGTARREATARMLEE